jgi:L,D-transpeptidase YcbB
VRALVYGILQERPGWSRAEIGEVIKSGERKDAKDAKDAKVAKPVPLYWIYVTAWATRDGVPRRQLTTATAGAELNAEKG